MAYNKVDVKLEEQVKPIQDMENIHTSILLIGRSGTGKTTSARTPFKDDSILYLDFDDKAGILRRSKRKNLMRIDLKFDYTEWAKHRAIVDQVYDLDKCTELAQVYQWMFVDGLTGMYALASQVAHNEVSGGNQFKLNYDKMDFVDDWVIRRLQRWSGMFKYFVLMAHEDYRETEDGVVRILPLARKRLSEAIPRMFQEIYHTDIVGVGDEASYVWRTKAEDNCGNTSGVENLPATVPNDFSLVLGTDWTKTKSIKDAIIETEKREERKVTGWKL